MLLGVNMDGNCNSLTPKKRPNDGGSDSRRVYKLKILLPNGTTVLVEISQGTEFITVNELVNRVKQQAEKTSDHKKSVNWDADLCFIDDCDYVFRNCLRLTKLELNRVYYLRLDDGSPPAMIYYKDMWDLTPDLELLMELPAEYTFEAALADLIDNSLQAVWANDESDKRLISVEVSNEKISIFDTGPGMDSVSIEKWEEMGATLHKAYKSQVIGGKPPYLKPAFGMFGYGGYIASMHLGRRIEVSSKTKIGKKVYTLHLERDALVSGSVSGSKATWRTYGGLRDPTNDELELSPGESFTKVEIFEPTMRSTNIRQLKCKLKDIYFPYIQHDDLSEKGRTIMPIEFQVNGDDLADTPGGEVEVTNLASCIGPEFILQVRFKLNHDNATMTSSQGTRSSNEANARLRCVYFPLKDGKESIESLIEALKEDGYDYIEEFGNFRHVSCRWLGRLLPDACWAWLPFMDFRQRKTDISEVFLKRSCMRVKCFIEADGGFSPTSSKTDFAHHDPYTTALMNLGNKQPLEKDSGVDIDIRRDGKSLNLTQLDEQYQLWLMEMHEKYDEVDSGIDEHVLIVNPSNKKELHISNDEDAWIICRTIDISGKDGCLLESVEENPKFNLQKSLSLPINVIDAGKCLAVADSERNNQIVKNYQNRPSSIEILNTRQCRELGIEASLPDEHEIIAVVRPGTYKSGIPSKHLDQKYVMKDNFEMSLVITYSTNKKPQDEHKFYSGRVAPSSLGDFHGLYVFKPRCTSHPLFQNGGIFTFTFSVGDSSCEKRVVKVPVKATCDVYNLM
ncbi:hypothetical protein M8C21_012168 [Ambrosia artemisiifolia]|uniref:SMCHD1 ribosomal S5 domain-containing protein n=1 Tax=Ambrosia artemisiifolia TaxID=4212 RepID=A0AAD5BPA6_AMBAR|nr:hypothetical protein M8C21_012168 [Ambrosia artemisiifolia]